MFRVFSQYVSAKSFLLMIGESAVIILSLLCAVKLRFWNSPVEFHLYLTLPDFALQTASVVVVCLACFYCNSTYDLGISSSLERALRIGESLGAASLLLGFLYFLFPSLVLGRGVLLIGMTLTTTFVLLGRKILDHVWQLSSPTQRVLILGTGELALEVARELTRRKDLGMKLEGFVSGTQLASDRETIFGFPVLGAASEMESIAKQNATSRIIVACEDRRGILPIRELVTLRVQGVRVDEASTALSALTGRIPLKTVQPSWFVFSDGFHRSQLNGLLKRILDLVVSCAVLVVSLPIMALVALATRLDSSGPVLYRQTRVGRMGKNFEVLKFRSMKMDAEWEGGPQWASENDPRITRFGRFLRKYRLDEFPQLINVIRGEMSFVGPRPERPIFVEDLRKTIPYYDERHSVCPGITGWAQVEFSYGSSVEDALRKLEYDLFYLKNMSVIFDLAIILKTIRIVVSGFGGR